MTFRAVAFCLRQSLLLFWGLPSRLDWLAIQPRDPAISSLHLSSIGIMVINMPSWLVFMKKKMWVWGIELKSFVRQALY